MNTHSGYGSEMSFTQCLPQEKQSCHYLCTLSAAFCLSAYLHLAPQLPSILL